MQLRAQYDFHIRELEFQRDEAARTKLTETAELRKQNNVLKDLVRGLDNQNQRRAHEYAASTPADDTFTPDFPSFDHLGIDDSNWDAGSLFGNEEFHKLDNHPQQQATPKPAPAKANVDSSSKELPFSWNAFYMCLLFGAFIASKGKGSSTTSSQLQARIPDLSEDYRAEAGAVLKAVLASTPESTGSLFTGGPRNMPQQQQQLSALDAMHTTLTAPSRAQELVSAFSLSASSYNHINHPEGPEHDDDDHELFNTPTPFERQVAEMQRQRAEVEQVINPGSAERSVLWGRVPEQVLRDFREMVGGPD